MCEKSFDVGLQASAKGKKKWESLKEVALKEASDREQMSFTSSSWRIFGKHFLWVNDGPVLGPAIQD